MNDAEILPGFSETIPLDLLQCDRAMNDAEILRQ